VVLGIEMYSLLVGEAASPEEQRAIRDAILDTGGVARLVQLRTMHMGPDEVLVVGGLQLDRELSADDAARVIDQAQARVREALPSARIIYLEPDLPAAVKEAR
jgi:divalent metal cation (Fe/Co/Zn/Cd) transporter